MKRCRSTVKFGMPAALRQGSGEGGRWIHTSPSRFQCQLQHGHSGDHQHKDTTASEAWPGMIYQNERSWPNRSSAASGEGAPNNDGGSKICRCAAYSWPHRRGGGKCLWNSANDDSRCEECGSVCQYASYKLDAHEKRPLSGDWCVQSKCCGAAVVQSGQYLTSDTA